MNGFAPLGYVTHEHVSKVVGEHLFPKLARQAETSPPDTDDAVEAEPALSDTEKVEVVRTCLHHLRRLLFARKLDAFYVSVMLEPAMQMVEPAFWAGNDANNTLFFGQYETTFEGASAIFFREGAIEAALSDNGSQADKPATAGRPSIQPAVRAAYDALYPEGHSARGHGWKTVAAEVGGHICQPVSEDTVQRAVKNG